jgi:hypothetical protein
MCARSWAWGARRRVQQSRFWTGLLAGALPQRTRGRDIKRIRDASGETGERAPHAMQGVCNTKACAFKCKAGVQMISNVVKLSSSLCAE